MSDAAINRTLRLLCALWVGAMAGFFWAFSVVIMPGMGRTDPRSAMAAMQAINDSVRNLWFAVGFFGATALCLLVVARTLLQRAGPASWVALTGGVVYVVGVFIVTVRFNVPLNEALADLDPTLAENGPAMTDYIEDWSAWNNVRTVAGLLASALLTSSLVLGRVPIGRLGMVLHGAAAER